MQNLENFLSSFIKKEQLNIDYKVEKVNYNAYKIQVYKIGKGRHKVLALPAYPHSGVLFFNILRYSPLVDLEIITLDLPGWIGNSDNLFKDFRFSYDECVKICKLILNHYQIEDFSIIGYSFGTSIATLLANELKHKIRKLVYISPFIYTGFVVYGDFTTEFFKFMSRRFSWILKMYINWRYNWVYRKKLIKNGYPPEAVKIYGKLILKTDRGVLYDSLRSLFFNLDLRKEIKNLRDIPMLIVNSKDETKMFAASAKYIRRFNDNDISLFFHGRHENFIITPDVGIYKKIVEFIQN